jgi:predicted ArsR family transcriptional regulator
MVKCTKGQVRRLKTALRWKIPPEQRQRIQMVLLRESGMTQPLIAAAMGVSLAAARTRLARFGAAAELPLREQVASALVNKGGRARHARPQRG